MRVLLKSSYSYKKRCLSLFTVLFFLSSIFSTFGNFASAATPDYQWVSESLIHSAKDNVNYNLLDETIPEGKAVIDALMINATGRDTGCPGGNKGDCRYYKSEGPIRTTGSDEDLSYVFYIISIKRDDPTVGHLDALSSSADGWSGSGASNIGSVTVDNTTNKAPSLQRRITVGNLYIGFDPLGDWQKNDFKARVDEASLGFRHNDPNMGGGAYNEDIEINLNNGEPFALIQFSTSDYVYEGLNRVSFKRTVDATCQGDASTGVSLAKVCTATIEGTVNFYLESDGNGGAIIKMHDKNDAVEIASPANNKSTVNNGDAIVMGVTFKISSPLDGIMESAMGAVLSMINKGIQVIGGYINRILNYGNDINNSKLGDVWTRVRNLSLGLLTLGILIIAFANILNLDLEKYGLNRMIPKLVIAIVMAYFSFLIIRFLLEVASALQTLALGGTTLDMANLGGGNFSAVFTGDIGAYTNSIGLLIVLFLIGFVMMIAMIVLCFVLLVRIVVIWFLVAVSPLAFLMMIMPFTENLYQQWWAKFWKWAFMGPAIAFMLYMTDTFLRAGFGVLSSTGANTASMGNADTWIFLMMATAGIFISASLPFTMGGDIYGAISSGIKKYGKYAPGVKQAKARLDLRRGSKESALKLRAMKAQAKLSGRGLPGRIFAGTTKTQAKMLDENLVTATSQEHGIANLDEAKLKEYLTSNNIYAARASARQLASRKRLGANIDGSNAERVSDLIKNDGALNASVNADNRDAFAAMAGTGMSAHRENAEKYMAGTEIKDWKSAQWKYASKTNTGRTLIANQLKSKSGREALFRNIDQGGLASMGQVLRDNPGLYKEINSYGASIQDPGEQALLSDQMRRVQDAYTNHVVNITGSDGKPGKGPLD